MCGEVSQQVAQQAAPHGDDAAAVAASAACPLSSGSAPRPPPCPETGGLQWNAEAHVRVGRIESSYEAQVIAAFMLRADEEAQARASQIERRRQSRPLCSCPSRPLCSRCRRTHTAPSRPPWATHRRRAGRSRPANAWGVGQGLTASQCVETARVRCVHPQAQPPGLQGIGGG